MWWLIGALAWLFLGVITYNLYGHMLWYVDTDHSETFPDWFYDKTTAPVYFTYLAAWPYFLLTMTYSYVKFRSQQDNLE